MHAAEILSLPTDVASEPLSLLICGKLLVRRKFINNNVIILNESQAIVSQSCFRNHLKDKKKNIKSPTLGMAVSNHLYKTRLLTF